MSFNPEFNLVAVPITLSDEQYLESQNKLSGKTVTDAQKSPASKWRYITALVVGMLFLIGAGGFGAIGLIHSHGITLPHWLQWIIPALNTVGNTAHSWSLWTMAVGGGVVGIALISYSSYKIYQIRAKASQKQSDEQKNSGMQKPGDWSKEVEDESNSSQSREDETNQELRIQQAKDAFNMRFPQRSNVIQDDLAIGKKRQELLQRTSLDDTPIRYRNLSHISHTGEAQPIREYAFSIDRFGEDHFDTLNIALPNDLVIAEGCFESLFNKEEGYLVVTNRNGTYKCYSRFVPEEDMGELVADLNSQGYAENIEVMKYFDGEFGHLDLRAHDFANLERNYFKTIDMSSMGGEYVGKVMVFNREGKLVCTPLIKRLSISNLIFDGLIKAGYQCDDMISMESFGDFFADLGIEKGEDIEEGSFICYEIFNDQDVDNVFVIKKDAQLQCYHRIVTGADEYARVQDYLLSEGFTS